jgi:hypothetical protein
MHTFITGVVIMMAALALAACADPFGPGPTIATDPTVIAQLARARPAVPAVPPDSAGIPPSIPPVYEEAPPGLDVPE